MNRQLNRNLEPAQLPGQVARLLGHPGRVGMKAAVRVQDPAAVDLDEYQHVESPEQDRVDGKEVAADDRSGMRLQELRPSGSLAARSWRHAVAAQNASDCGCRNPVAQLDQLALDAAIAPARVLTTEAEDQLSELLRNRRPATARSQPESRPVLTHEFAVPEQVAGENMSRPGGIRKPRAAKTKRSAGTSSGPFTWRRRTAT